MKLSCSILLLSVQVASAQAPPPPEGASVQSVLPGIQPTQVGGTLDARGDYTLFDQDSIIDDPISITVAAQYVAPEGWGVYGVMPISHASVANSSHTGLDNLEAGGLYVVRNSPTTDIYLKGGIALNTAGRNEDVIGLLVNLIPRPEGTLVSGGDVTWLRAHAGLRTHGPVQVGVNVGFDVPTDNDKVKVDGILVATGAIGFVQPGFSLSAGVTYLREVGADSNNPDFSVFNATVDFDVSPKAKLFVAFGLDLEDLDNSTNVSFGFGVRAALGR